MFKDKGPDVLKSFKEILLSEIAPRINEKSKNKNIEDELVKMEEAIKTKVNR